MGSPWAGSQPSWGLCWVAGDFHISFLHFCPVSLKSPAPCLAEPMGSPELEVHHLCQDLDCKAGHCRYPSWVARQGGIPTWFQTASLLHPRDPVWAIHGLDGGAL